MGSLYVSCASATSLEDLTLRASRTVRQVSLVVASEATRAAGLLSHLGVATPAVGLARSAEVLAALETGDVLLLLEGELAGPSPPALALVESALSSGYPVVPVPGPSLPIAALVLSGFPTDSFLYLGRLPASSFSRRELLAGLAAERRTLVLPVDRRALGDLLAELHEQLGDRPAVLVAGLASGVEAIWQGTLGDVPPSLLESDPAPCVLVVAGARETAPRWEEERLRAEIRVGLLQGLEAKEIARRLASGSGWPRREIYRLTVQAARLSSNRAM